MKHILLIGEHNACAVHILLHHVWQELDQSGYKILFGFMTVTVAGVSLGLPGFGDNSFASYPAIEDALFSLHIQLAFLAQTIDNSLLLYDAFNSQGTSDFVALVIKDGYLEFRYDLGTGRYPEDWQVYTRELCNFYC